MKQNAVDLAAHRNFRQRALKRMGREFPNKCHKWIDRSLLQLNRNGFRLLAWRNPLTTEGNRLFVRLRASGPIYIQIITSVNVKQIASAIETMWNNTSRRKLESTPSILSVD